MIPTVKTPTSQGIINAVKKGEPYERDGVVIQEVLVVLTGYSQTVQIREMRASTLPDGLSTISEADYLKGYDLPVSPRYAA